MTAVFAGCVLVLALALIVQWVELRRTRRERTRLASLLRSARWRLARGTREPQGDGDAQQ